MVDMQFVDQGNSTAAPMTDDASRALANVLTALVVVLEAALFVWCFGILGLSVFIASTMFYTMYDARALKWLKGLLENRSAGSDG